MSAAPQENPVQTHEAQKKAEEETNLVKQRKHYERQLEQEKQSREQAEFRLARFEKDQQERRSIVDDSDDNDDEPYVDHKKLAKKFSAFEQNMEKKIEQKAEEKARKLLEQDRQSQWLRNNPDFEEVMEHAQKFYEKDRNLAENILQMPEGFERQKLAYHTIKALGIHKKEEPKANIQETIDKNRRSPYYQPSGVGTAPYGIVSGGKDVSPADGKNAYAKMQELKSRLRLG